MTGEWQVGSHECLGITEFRSGTVEKIFEALKSGTTKSALLSSDATGSL
jgi:hypothetical protein